MENERRKIIEEKNMFIYSDAEVKFQMIVARLVFSQTQADCGSF
jgi:hypothetical protein